MMWRLEPAQYDSVRPLLSPLWYRPAIEAVMHGTSPGDVYADDAQSPTVAVVVEDSGHFYVSGDTQKTEFDRWFHDELVEHIFAGHARVGRSFSYFVYAQPTWEPKLSMLLSDHAVRQGVRCCFLLNPAEAPPARGLRVPPDFQLRPVNEDLVNSDLDHVEQVRAELDTLWSSQELFYELNMGKCLVHDHAVVSWCLPEYLSDGRCGIGIETREEFQNRGLGTIVAQHFVSDAVEKDLRLHWDAWKSNTPSTAVARKVGFSRYIEYPVLLFRYLPSS